VSALLKRLQASLPVRLLMAYGNSQAGNYASVVAFNAFMTMFPLILGVLTIVGLVVGGEQGAVRQALVGTLPAHDQIDKALNGLHNNAGLFGIISFLGLIWTGTNFFSALEFALDQVYGEPQRNLIRQRLMGVLMLLAFVVAMLVSVGASTLVAFLRFVPFLGFVVGAAVMVALLVLIYWVVPNRRQRWRDVWPGAVLCGVLIEVLTLVWPIYTSHIANFNSYGGTFGLFFLLATWLYFMSALMLLGAVFNKMRLGGQPVPQAEGAPALAAVQDAERRRVQVKSSGRRRPET
jgi:YihY family inner membrane protein